MARFINQKVLLLSLVSLPLLVSGVKSASADVGVDNGSTFFHSLDVLIREDRYEDGYDRQRARIGWSGLFKVGDIYLGPMVHGGYHYFNNDQDSVSENVTVNGTLGGEIYYAATKQPFIPSIAAGYYKTSAEVVYTDETLDRDYSYQRDIFTLGVRQDVGKNFSAGIKKSRWDIDYDNNFRDVELDYTYLNASFYPTKNWSVSLQKMSGDSEAVIVGGKFKIKSFAVKLDYYSWKGDNNSVLLGLQWNFGGRKGVSIQQDDRISFLNENLIF